MASLAKKNVCVLAGIRVQTKNSFPAKAFRYTYPGTYVLCGVGPQHNIINLGILYRIAETNKVKSCFQHAGI